MSKFYSQKSYPQYLGNSKTSIASSGCLLTSIANKTVYDEQPKDPLEINELAIKCGAFSGASLICPTIAKALEYIYEKRMGFYDGVSVCETDHYKKVGFPQHFFLYNSKTKKRIDPLDLSPEWEPNTYNIVSFRVFTPVEPPVSTPVKPIYSTLNPVPSQTTTTSPEAQNGATSPIDLGSYNLSTEPVETIVEPKTIAQWVDKIINIILDWLKIK